MIEICLITNWEKADSYQDAWNGLVSRLSEISDDENRVTSLPSIFQTFEWHKTWWQSFGDKDHELMLLLAFRETELVGIAPLVTKRRKLPLAGKIIYWIGTTDSIFSSDFCSFIVREDTYEEVMDAFMEWLYTHSEYWDEIVFKNIPEDSRDIRYLQKKMENRSKLEYFQDAPTRYLLETDNLSSLRHLLPRRYKSNYKKLKKTGDINWNCLDNAKSIHPKLAMFFEQHIKRRAHTSQPSFFRHQTYQNFFRMLVENLAPKGWLLLFTTDLDEKTITHYLVFKFRDKYYLYTPSFDISLMKYSIGELQLYSLFESALNQNIKEINFGAGSEEYKYRYTNNITKLYQFHAFKSLPRYVLFKIVKFCRKCVRNLLKTFSLSS